MAKKLNLPLSRSLTGISAEVPFVLLGDQSFALTTNIMIPYLGLNSKGSEKHIFNYCLCRACRVPENAFGILSAVFQVFRKPILLKPQKAEFIAMAAICLHNFFCRSPTWENVYALYGTFNMEEDGRVIPGTWRTANNTPTTCLQDFRKLPHKAA